MIAPDKFKGSLSAMQVAQALGDGVAQKAPDAQIALVPIADGGEGTVESAVAAGFGSKTVTVTGPLGEPVEAEYAIREGTAVIELAQASGLALVPPDQRRPLEATTRGTGELIKHALDEDCREIILGVGGSATIDGGAGILQALGVSLTDSDGDELPGGGGALARLVTADLSGLDRRLAKTQLTLASDVTNLLTGAKGAATVYGPQKGATDSDIANLDAAMENFVSVLASVKGECIVDAASSEGAGAAGGAGFAAVALLDAVFRPGIDVVLKLVNFDAALDDAALVITGEGSLDVQSLSGKAPVGVAKRAAKREVPVVAVAGIVKLKLDDVRQAGFVAAYSLLDHEPDLEVCMTQTQRLLTELGAEIAAERLGGSPD